MTERRFRQITDCTTGATFGEEILGAELDGLLALEAMNLAAQAADDQAKAAAVATRAQRQQLYQQVQDIATLSWAQISDALTEARAAITRPTAQWTNVLVIDGVKLALRMGLFLVARELRRVYQNREPD